MNQASPLKLALIEVVHQIPYGKVSSYGVVGRILSNKLEQNVPAKIVGFILSSMPHYEWSSCPWRRVVSKPGYISTLKLGEKGIVQVQLLEKEGISVENGRVKMSEFEYIFSDIA